ncbi:putative cytochrome P450 132 [Candidatus Entotheonellaceae bacterium PAL068K]
MMPSIRRAAQQSLTLATRTRPAPGPRGRARRQSRRCLRHQALTEYLALRARFGDVVRLQTFPRPLYLLSHPDAVQYVLRDHASNYRKGVLFEPIAALQGQGLLTSDGALWRQQRRLMQPVFQPRQVALHGATMVDEAQAVVQAWRQAARTGKPVNINAWMHRLAFRVVARGLLGIAPDALDDVAQQLQALAVPLMRYFSTRSTHRWALPSWVPTRQRRRLRRAVATYQALVQQLIKARRHHLGCGEVQATDVLARLIAAHDHPANTAMTDQQLRDEVITLIGAGVETSALALSWTWYLLAHHLEVAHQMQAELEIVLGGRPPRPDDLPHLPYGRMVLDETLRLYSPSAVLPRQVNTADVISGYAVPRDAVVILSQYVTHRHPDFWPEPEHFCPERFTPALSANRHRFAYFPFGAGPRVCIGNQFSLMEMHLALSTLAQAYALKTVPGRPVVPVLATTQRPRHGLWMTVHARW